MKYYKLYIEQADGSFTSYYQMDYMGKNVVIGQKEDWRSLKSADYNSDDDDEFWTPLFGLKTEEECIPFFKSYFPCLDSIEEDIEYASIIKDVGTLVLVECEGDVRNWEDPQYGSSPEGGNGQEMWFDTQTVLRVVRRFTFEEVVGWIKESWENR